MQANADPLDVFVARILRRSGSRQTVISYKFMVLWFLKFLDLSPSQFLAKVERGEIIAEDQLNNWLDHLQANGTSPATQRVSYFAIKKFLLVNLPRFQFYWQTVELPRVRNIEPDRIPSKSELLRIMNHAELKDRVIVTLAVSSGIRESALAGLKVKDVALDLYPDVGVVSVPAQLSKGGFAYVTFITPQARGLLEEYLRSRKTKDPESPLLLDDRETGPQTGKNLARRWNKLLQKTNLDEKGKRLRVLRFHVLRKYCATALTSAGVNVSARERILGHKGGGVDSNLSLDSAYYRPSTQDLLEQYRKAIPNLTIAEETASDFETKRQTILSVIEILGFDHGIKEKVRAAFDESSSYEEAVEKSVRVFRAAKAFREIREESEKEMRAHKRKDRGKKD